MKASDIMTKDVITVGPDVTIREIAVLMTQHRISGVPVVDAGGNLVGIISESDLLHRTETGTERQRKWWLGVFTDSDTLAREYAKAHGVRAADVMTQRVVSVDESADLGAVADLLDSRKRLPVMSNGRLAGMITRGDLVRALAQTTITAGATSANDHELAKAIYARIQKASWLNAAYASVSVTDGVAELNGLLPSADQRRAMHVLVEETPGVTRVVDNLRVGQLSASL